jgi:proteasome lid subunit RPN8/RPN11
MLVLPPALRCRIAAWATDGYPQEACGLLLGREGGGSVEVVDVRLARNLNRERARDRYELDLSALLAADLAAREARLEIVGVWHSHPDHPARPSETDRAAAWPGWSYVILAVEQGSAAELRSWRLDGGVFVEERVEVEAALPSSRRRAGELHPADGGR